MFQTLSRPPRRTRAELEKMRVRPDPTPVPMVNKGHGFVKVKRDVNGMPIPHRPDLPRERKKKKKIAHKKKPEMPRKLAAPSDGDEAETIVLSDEEVAAIKAAKVAAKAAKAAEEAAAKLKRDRRYGLYGGAKKQHTMAHYVRVRNNMSNYYDKVYAGNPYAKDMQSRAASMRVKSKGKGYAYYLKHPYPNHGYYEAGRAGAPGKFRPHMFKEVMDSGQVFLRPVSRRVATKSGKGKLTVDYQNYIINTAKLAAGQRAVRIPYLKKSYETTAERRMAKYKQAKRLLNKWNQRDVMSKEAFAAY